MRFSTLCFALLGLVFVSVQAESVDPDPNAWFKNEYAPLWQKGPWDRLDEIAEYYNETITVHRPGGKVPVVSSQLWLSQSIEDWKSDGWVSSDLTGHQSDQLNPSTVLIKARWLDRFADGTEESSCGWYLADLIRDRWVFTEYAEIDCKDHDI